MRALDDGRQVDRGWSLSSDLPRQTMIQRYPKLHRFWTVDGHYGSLAIVGRVVEVVDLGTDVPEEKFIEIVRGNGADVVAMSALLTTTMPQMKTVITALSEAGLRDQVKVIIGGAPVTESYAQEIGADGYAADASRAVKVTKSLL